MNVVIGEYMISPYCGNTCWRIQKRAKKDLKSEWSEAIYYPSTFSQAIQKVRELMRMDKQKTYSIDKLIKELKQIDCEILEGLNDIKL